MHQGGRVADLGDLDQPRLRAAPRHLRRGFGAEQVGELAAQAITGPASFSTSLRTGVAACAASAMPISPPMEVPTQCTASTSSRAISVTMSATYCGTA